MEKLLSAPYFQVTLAAVVGIGVVALGLALAVFKFFLPSLGKALLSSNSSAPAEGEPKALHPVIIDPKYCTACEAEHQRSLRNEANVEKLFGKFDDGFKAISKEIGDTKTEIIKALAAKN